MGRERRLPGRRSHTRKDLASTFRHVDKEERNDRGRGYFRSQRQYAMALIDSEHNITQQYGWVTCFTMGDQATNMIIHTYCHPYYIDRQTALQVPDPHICSCPAEIYIVTPWHLPPSLYLASTSKYRFGDRKRRECGVRKEECSTIPLSREPIPGDAHDR